MATTGQVAKAFSKANPGFSVEISVPSWPRDLSKRYHNAFAKEALRRTLVKHHEQTLPGHFKQEAHSKYGYAQRNQKYIIAKNKRYGTGGIDLVKSGASRDQILSKDAREIVMSGAAEGGKKELSGTLKVRFAFKGGTGAQRYGKESRQQVTTQQMISEVQRFTPAESRDAAIEFLDQYWQQLNEYRNQRGRITHRN